MRRELPSHRQHQRPSRVQQATSGGTCLYKKSSPASMFSSEEKLVVVEAVELWKTGLGGWPGWARFSKGLRKTGGGRGGEFSRWLWAVV